MTPTLLFLPGTWCDRRVWAPCAALLAPRWPRVHVDLRDGDSIAGMAARALAAADGAVVPVGLSMGGIVALEMWRQAPARMPAMALFGVNPGADTPARAAGRAALLRRMATEELEAVASELALAYFSEQPPPPALRDTVVAMAREAGAVSYAAQSTALATRLDAWPRLAGIDVPVLLACGELDGICPLEQHERMAAQLPRWTLSPIRRAGHLAPLEQPALAALALQSWLQLCFPADAGPIHQPS